MFLETVGRPWESREGKEIVEGQMRMTCESPNLGLDTGL